MPQSVLSDSVPDYVEAAIETNYGFECVLDAPSLVAVLQNQDKDGTKLEKWLRAPLVKIYIPQDVLTSLKNQRTDAAQKTLLALDRVTNHFSSVRFEQSLDSYQTFEGLLCAPKPTIHWHDFVAKRSVGNDEIAALSASLGSAMQLHSNGPNGARPAVLQGGQLKDSAPLPEQPAFKMLAPIGTGRPGRNKSINSSAIEVSQSMEDKASNHPVFRYMWFKMNEKAEEEINHIWLLVSSNPVLEKGAKELGVPCMSHESLDKVLSSEFPETNKRSSRSHQTLNGNGSFLFKAGPQGLFSHHHYQLLNISPSNGTTGLTPSGQLSEYRDQHMLEHSSDGLITDSSSLAIPTAPRSMRVNAAAHTDRPLGPSGVIMVDPNSFNRSHMNDDQVKSTRLSRTEFTPGHRYRNSGHEPPPNAPIGPRSMSGSSGKSRPTIKPLSPNASPVLNSSTTLEQQTAVASLTNSPRFENSPFDRAASADLGQVQRPASRGTTASAQPGSPRMINGSPQLNANNRGQRAPRHIPYVPPKAREQLVQQAGKTATPATTNQPGNIDLTKPIDPDSFGRGQVTPGATKSQPVTQHNHHHHSTNNKRGNTPRGGSMRGRGHRGSMRGRGVSNGDRKLFDPS